MKLPINSRFAEAFIAAFNSKGFTGAVARTLANTVEFRVYGDVTVPKDATRIPRGMVFMGALLGTGCSLTRLDHQVLGYALLQNSMLTEVGSDTRVRGRFDASGSPVSRFLGRVDGGACFQGCQSLSEISLTQHGFGGDLDASGCPKLAFFHAEVAGDANFSGCRSLVAISDGSRFRRGLDISDTGIKSLRLHQVGGSVNATGCGEMTEAVVVVDGGANFQNCRKLEKIGFGSEIFGTLNLRGTAVTDLKGVYVGGSTLRDLEPPAGIPSNLAAGSLTAVVENGGAVLLAGGKGEVLLCGWRHDAWNPESGPFKTAVATAAAFTGPFAIRGRMVEREEPSSFGPVESGGPFFLPEEALFAGGEDCTALALDKRKGAMDAVLPYLQAAATDMGVPAGAGTLAEPTRIASGGSGATGLTLGTSTRYPL